MLRTLSVLLAVSMIACSQVAIEGVTLKGASQASGSDRESERNLAAIKALLVRERQQFRVVLTPINRASGSPLQAGPIDDVSASSSSPTSISKGMTSSHLLDLLSLAPHPRTEAYRQLPQAQGLAPTTRSTADYQTHDRPTLPPYTFYAPTGSAYPGTIRCVPDYLGGQRCHNSP
jgi:hypothetical protein